MAGGLFKRRRLADRIFGEKMIQVKKVGRDTELSFWEKLYLPAVIKGLFITAAHWTKNLIHPKKRITIEYPEVKKELPLGARAEHRLMQRSDGSIRCTACMLCATACPANCISIAAEESPDMSVEKRAKEYSIDMLRCVFCGLCVEACPCDAIRMDTYKYENSAPSKGALIYDKEKLLSNHAEGQSPYSTAL